jgi:hypothetical protein
MIDNGIWSFNKQMGSGVGFIYIIYDKYMNKAYLGKKTYKAKIHWKTYKSSSKIIKEMLRERVLSDFKFICVEEYKTLGALSYAETWSLCYLETPTSDQWYNKLIQKVSWNVHERITDKHKLILDKVKLILNRGE